MNIELITHQLATTYYQQLIAIHHAISLRNPQTEPMTKQEAAQIKSLWSMLRSCRAEAKAFGNVDLDIDWPSDLPVAPLPPKEENNNPPKKDTKVAIPAAGVPVPASDSNTVAATGLERYEYLKAKRQKEEQERIRAAEAAMIQMAYSSKRRHSY